MALLGGPMKASDLFVRCGLALLLPDTLCKQTTCCTAAPDSALSQTGRWRTKTSTTSLASQVLPQCSACNMQYNS